MFIRNIVHPGRRDGMVKNRTSPYMKHSEVFTKVLVVRRAVGNPAPSTAYMERPLVLPDHFCRPNIFFVLFTIRSLCSFQTLHEFFFFHVNFHTKTVGTLCLFKMADFPVKGNW